MPRRNFRTVAEELLEAAETAADYYSNHGYSVRVEKSELGFPYTPTMVCKRQRTTLIVEVDAHIRLDRLRDWVSFGKSTGKDTRLVLVLPNDSLADIVAEDNLRKMGIGLQVAQAGRCVERLAGRDLALGVELPELASLPFKLRQLLGPAYEQFDRAQWREGFEEACQAFEAEARRYLKAGLRSRRVVITSKKGLPPSASDVDRMTMGKLADTFARNTKPNRADAIIGQTLKVVNKDRVGVVHHKTRQRTESRLRTNVGRHMWSLIAAMKELV